MKPEVHVETRPVLILRAGERAITGSYVKVGVVPLEHAELRRGPDGPELWDKGAQRYVWTFTDNEKELYEKVQGMVSEYARSIGEDPK